MNEQAKEEKFSFEADPQKNFTNVILWNMKTIQPAVYSNYHRGGESILDLRAAVLGIMQSFRKQEQDTVFKAEITLLKDEYADVSREKLREIFAKIWMFLHESYLKDVNAYSGIDPNKEAEKL